MKRKLSLLLAVVMMFSIALAGCGKKATDSNSDASQGQQTDAKEDKKEDKQEKKVDNPASKRANAKDTLIIGMTEAKGELLPVYYSTKYDAFIVQLVFDGLMTNNEAAEIVPHVAKEYKVSDDHLTYTFTLRDDVKFSDGTPLTAKDVAFTYTLLADPSYDGRYKSVVREMVGYKEYSEGDATELAGIKVEDDHTISFTFTEAKADNITKFDMGIMPEHHYAIEKGNIQAIKDKMQAFDLVGSGAYKFKKFEPKQFVELEANPDHFRGEPKIKNLITKFTTAETSLQELAAGSIDVQLQVPSNNDNLSQIEAPGYLDIAKYPANSYGFMMFNVRDERLADVKVRQALVYGFDRAGFIDLYYDGNASVLNTPLSKVSWAYSDDINSYEFDPEKAKALLEEAGWKVGADGIREKDGKKLSFVWDTYTESKYVDTLIPLLQADWAEIGVKVEPNLMDFNAMVDKVFTQQDFEMTNLAWSLTIDPGSNYTTFHSSADEPDGNNAGGLRDPEIDRLLEAGSKEFDFEKRKAIYQEFGKRMNELVPYMFLNQGDQWDVYNQRVKNFKATSFCDWTYYILDMELVD
ncbi:MAG: peptide ABC transporter [Epulopiscium sp.]|nr:peptide ABC transporter [Candidatus Epulonipiscium sp.]